MIIEEKKPEIVKNPYSWPKSYYMETDPKERLLLLEEQLAKTDLTEEEQRENQLRQKLWKKRYQQKNSECIDLFLRGFLFLQYVSGNLNSSFQKKHNQKESLKSLKDMCADQADVYGEDLLKAELKHMVMVYVLTCMDDKRYRSVILGFGKISDDKTKSKIRDDVEALTVVIPESLGLQKEFELLTQAGREALVELGLI